MYRSLRYLALASSGILSGVVAYKYGTFSQHEQLNVVYAAGDRALHQQPPTPVDKSHLPEVLRSHLAFSSPQSWDKNWDFREPAHEASSARRSGGSSDRVPSLAERFGGGGEGKPPSPEVSSKPSATRNLIFVRHGDYVNADKKEDKILTKLGREQASLAGGRLGELHKHKNITKLIISSMVRAKETGDIIRRQLPADVQYEYCDFLIEGAPCKPEPPSSSWKPDSHEIYQDSARIEAAFRRYFHRADPEQKDDSLEVYVCHANVIRYFVCRALQLPPEAWLRMNIDNCGLTWFKISPSGRVSLKSMGDIGHLPPEMTSLRHDIKNNNHSNVL